MLHIKILKKINFFDIFLRKDLTLLSSFSIFNVVKLKKNNKGDKHENNKTKN